MADNYTFFGPLNSYIPVLNASLIVQYARNPKAFPYQRYTDIRPSTSMVGAYRKLKSEMPARVVDIDRFRWAEGQKNPAYDSGLNGEQFEFIYYTCQRYAPSEAVGDLTVQQAQATGFNLLADITNSLASQAATLRSQRIVNKISAAANWTGFTNTMTAIAGGKITSATSTNPYIRILFQDTINTIVKNTNASIQPSDIRAVMSPGTAAAINQSQEFIDFIKQQPGAEANLQGEGNLNARWWLPQNLYGVEVVVEDSVVVTNEAGAASTTRSYMMPDGVIVFLTKQGAIQPSAGGTASTFVMWTYQDFSIEVFPEPQHKRQLVNVIDNTFEDLVSIQSGYLVTACT